MNAALPDEQTMAQECNLRRRVKLFTWLFIIGLVLSGATAIPLKSEVGALANFAGNGSSGITQWIFHVRDALDDTGSHHPFLFYGTDWLAFGHFVIAIAFIGALRDPARNRWLFDFGLIACALVIPYALIFGELRGIPLWWRLLDCSFGIIGALPVWLCRKWTIELENHGLAKS
ncbi:MAG TPA: hypothetical protein VGI03_01080 [Verrucomicrobiae bacterium]|jgi:hypothetical protein